MKDRSGWSASLFVSPPPDQASYAEAPPVPPPAIVNATVGRRLSKTTRLTLDVTNLFDRKLPSEDYFFQPAQPRGLMLRLRKTF